MIRTFRSGPLGLAKDQPLPSRLVVMPWGDNEINGGEVLRVNATTLRELPLNQKRVNFDRVALDFNHNSVEGTPFYKGEPAKVAGFATLSVIEGEGIVYDDIQYTPEGEDALRGGHYIDLSPAVKHNEAGEVIFLHSCAACRQGQVRGLSILAADPFENDASMKNDKSKKGEAGEGTGASVRSEIERLREDEGMTLAEIGSRVDRDESTLGAIISGEIANPPAALLSALKALNSEPPEHDMDHKKLLTAILGLSADATDAEISEATEGLDLKTMASTLTEQADTIKTFSAKVEELESNAKTVKLDDEAAGQLRTLTAKIEELEKRDIERERTAILSAAMDEGKLVPASAKDLTVDQLRTLCSELPADQVPLERRTPEHIKLLSASRPDTGEEAVRKSLGISEDDWKKFND